MAIFSTTNLDQQGLLAPLWQMLTNFVYPLRQLPSSSPDQSKSTHRSFSAAISELSIQRK
jgi:hypothetical protein